MAPGEVMMKKIWWQKSSGIEGFIYNMTWLGFFNFQNFVRFLLTREFHCNNKVYFRCDDVGFI